MEPPAGLPVSDDGVLTLSGAEGQVYWLLTLDDPVLEDTRFGHMLEQSLEETSKQFNRDFAE